MKKHYAEMLCKKAFLRNFVKLTGKHLPKSFLLKDTGLQFYYKESLATVISWEFYKLFKNTDLAERLWTVAPEAAGKIRRQTSTIKQKNHKSCNLIFQTFFKAAFTKNTNGRLPLQLYTMRFSGMMIIFLWKVAFYICDM